MRLRLFLVVFALVAAGMSPSVHAAVPALPAGGFDYQLGGAYPPPAAATIVVRDRLDPPAPGKFNICYINGWQAQESERAWWERNHPELLLRDASGRVVIDPNWNEALLDIRTPAKRSKLLAIEGRWIDRCAADGFKAVDPDNYDSYSRSRGLLTATHAVAFAKLLITRAHQRGLAIGQKNAAELVGRAPFDFIVSEQCRQYNECVVYTNQVGSQLLDIEYNDTAFNAACATPGRTWRVIRRDLNLTQKGKPGYVYKSC